MAFQRMALLSGPPDCRELQRCEARPVINLVRAELFHACGEGVGLGDQAVGATIETGASSNGLVERLRRAQTNYRARLGLTLSRSDRAHAALLEAEWSGLDILGLARLAETLAASAPALGRVARRLRELAVEAIAEEVRAKQWPTKPSRTRCLWC